MKLLIDHNADIEAKDKGQRISLCYACRNGHQATANLLLDSGAEIEAKTIDHWTPL